MHTKIANPILNRHFSTNEERPSNQNLPPNEGAENETHTHTTIKTPRKLSYLRENNGRLESDKDFNSPRVNAKGKQPNNNSNAYKNGRSTQNISKRKKVAIHKNKDEATRNFTYSDGFVRPSNLKTAQTFIFCSNPMQDHAVGTKEGENNRRTSQQFQLLRIYPHSKEHLSTVNNSSDCFSLSEESSLESIVLQNNRPSNGVPYDTVNSLIPKLINSKRTLYTTIVSDYNLRSSLDCKTASITAILADGDTKSTDEAFASYCANILGKISSYSMIPCEDIRFNTTLPSAMQNPISSVGHFSLNMTRMGTSQLTSTEQSSGTRNSKEFSILHKRVIGSKNAVWEAQIDKGNSTSPQESQRGLARKDCTTETESEMSALSKEKKNVKAFKKQQFVAKDGRESSRANHLHGQVTKKGVDNTSEKNLKRLSCMNQTVSQLKTLRKKNQCQKMNSYDTLPAWKPGGISRISSTNTAKQSGVKGHLSQYSNERNSILPNQAKLSIRRQKASSCEPMTEKDSSGLSTRSFNADNTRMMKIYNWIANANLGRGPKTGTDRNVINQKSSSSNDNGSQTRMSDADLAKRLNNKCSKSSQACSGNPVIIRKQDHATHTVYSSRSINSKKYRRNTNATCQVDGELSSRDAGSNAALDKRSNKTISYSRGQIANMHTNSGSNHPQNHESTNNNFKRTREPLCNSSEPIQKSGHKPMKKSAAFVMQNKPKKSINTCTISLDVLKEFFYRQGISAELIDRAERDLKKKYGGDGRSVICPLDEPLDCNKGNQTSKIERHDVDVAQYEETDIGYAKNYKNNNSIHTQTTVPKSTRISYCQVEYPYQMRPDKELNVDNVIPMGRKVLVTMETQTLQSLTSSKNVGTEYDIKLHNQSASTTPTKKNACVETDNVQSFSVSSNTEFGDQKSDSSDMSVLNDQSSIKNENLLAVTVFESSSNKSTISTASPCCSRELSENASIKPKPDVSATTTVLTTDETPAKPNGEKRRIRKPPWSSQKFSKAYRRVSKKRQGQSSSDCNTRKTDDHNAENALPRSMSDRHSNNTRYGSDILHSDTTSRNCKALSSRKNEAFDKDRALSVKRSLSNVTLPEVRSFMELVLRQVDNMNTDDTNSLTLRDAPENNQLVSAEKIAEPGVSSFSAFSRACLLSFVYGTVCLFVFSCLRFSVTCDFGSSYNFS